MELLDIDEEKKTEKPEKEKKSHNGLLRALLVTGIFIAALLALIVGMTLLAWKKGYIIVGTQTTDEAGNVEALVYTESQMQELLSEKEKEAEALISTESQLAMDEGYAQGKNELLEYIMDKLLESRSSLTTIRSLYPDYVVVVSNNAYHFLPINHDLEMSDLVQDQLEVGDDGEFRYHAEDGSVISHKGIDVSEYQGNINWEKVAADGVEFAIVRAYYRGYGTGRFVEDTKAVSNIKGAVDNGLHVGLYVFSQAINEEEAAEEANMAIDMISPYVPSGAPIVIDVERVAGANARMDVLTVEERTNVILTFCNIVEEAGYIPMIYFNTEMGALFVDLTKLEGISKWYAWYGEDLYFPYKYDLWQYKDTGSVDGISGAVDMNIALNCWWE